LVTNNWEPEAPVLMVDYYQPIARQAGLSRTDVGLSLLSATDGLPVGSYYEGTTAMPIYIKSVDNEGEETAALENIPVWSVLPSRIVTTCFYGPLSIIPPNDRIFPLDFHSPGSL